MDISKFKVNLYDMLAVALPGLLLIFEVWVTVRGWHPFASALLSMSATTATVLLLVAFGIGDFLQELGNYSLTLLFGERYSKASRDDFWKNDPDAELVKQRLRAEFSGRDVSVDTAFDFCLTKIQGQFDKRDVFVAIADLARSLVMLSILAAFPLVRVLIVDTHLSGYARDAAGAAILGAIVAVVTLFAQRMKRFRALSEVTVFRAFLGSRQRADDRVRTATAAQTD